MRRAAAITFMFFTAACAGCSGGKPPPPQETVPIDNGGGGDDDQGGDTEPGNEGEDGLFPDHLGATKAGASAMHDEASRQLGKVKSTTYSHKTHIDENAGVFDYDCSGFIDYTLSNVKPEAFTELQHATVKRPLAKHIVDFVVTIGPNTRNNHWERVAHAADLQPGDIVAWLKPADVTSKNTGHVMMVNGPVTREAGGVIVPIMDSTSARHGKSDSRYSSKATGLGTGEMVLATDAAGAPIGYRWSTWKKSKTHLTTVALGRIVE